MASTEAAMAMAAKAAAAACWFHYLLLGSTRGSIQSLSLAALAAGRHWQKSFCVGHNSQGITSSSLPA
eukprot:14510629-Alexandrium_andersonii.AAC.1